MRQRNLKSVFQKALENYITMRSLFSKLFPTIIITVTLLACGVAIYVYMGVFFGNGYSSKPEIWGVFGDYIGGVLGTVVTTATVFFLLLTLNAQNKAKNDTFFISLLQINERQIASLGGTISNNRHVGKEYLREVVIQCRKLYHALEGGDLGEKVVKTFLDTIMISLVAYLNHSAEIIDFINSFSIVTTKSQSKQYANIYLAQLSNEEKIILGYLCALSPIAEERGPLTKEKKSKIYHFYSTYKIKATIDYEDHLDGHSLQKPDAIKGILKSI
jgi:hypothetical protein